MMSEIKTIKGIKLKDIADSFVLPHRRKKVDKEKIDADFLKDLNEKRAVLGNESKLKLKFLKFKFELEDYIKSDGYNDAFTFGYFLKNYLGALNKSNKDFAEEIDVTRYTVGAWLNKNIEPNEEIFIRLELHSNNTISAVNWLRVIEKRKESRVLNSELRRKQTSHVKKHLEFSL